MGIMKMNKSFYILGLPIEIEDVGKLNFIKIKDLPQFSLYQNILIIPKAKLVKLYIDNIDIDEKEDKDELYKYIIKNVSLYKLIKNIRELHDLYLKAFEFCFKEDVSNKITENNFEQIRQLIMDMNCLKEEEFNPNPEIQKWIEKSKKFKSEGIEFEDIVSSVAVYTGYTYEQINELTLYQFYTTFQRIGAFKSYDTNTLFATVSTEKINIESWCKHIDLFENEEKEGLTRDAYNKLKSGIFG